MAIVGLAWWLPNRQASDVVTTTTGAPIAAADSHLSRAGLPTARFGFAMAYDSSVGKVILFAGGVGPSGDNDTWTFDRVTNTWTELEPLGDRPPALSDSDMVYDPIGQRMILFGGDYDYSPLNRTWALDADANTWTELQPEGELPPGRAGHAMVYDSIDKKIFLFGGFVYGESAGPDATFVNDLWAYDPAANAWTELHPGGGLPPGRTDACMVYDSDSGKVILFGGNGTDSPVLNDTWAYDPAANAWTELHPGGDLPSAREGHCMVYEPAGRRTLLFGGKGSPGMFSDTWAYDSAANTWSLLEPAGAPPNRSDFGMVYDSDSRRAIMFGGWTDIGVGYLNDTWAYDPSADVWTDLEPLGPVGNVPSPRTGHSMFYDPRSGNVILFGGAGEHGTVNDTWAYDPAANAWTELHETDADMGRYSGDSPPPGNSFGPTMVYDSDRGKALLFGTQFATDTWTYDPGGNAWSLLRTAGDVPDFRFAFSVAYDSGVGKVILFGGWADEQPGDFENPWAYDPGANSWTRAPSGWSSLPWAGVDVSHGLRPRRWQGASLRGAYRRDGG